MNGRLSENGQPVLLYKIPLLQMKGPDSTIDLDSDGSKQNKLPSHIDFTFFPTWRIIHGAKRFLSAAADVMVLVVDFVIHNRNHDNVCINLR